jgi:CPA2 family monovalent cation:H+ antiporter-2
VEAVIHYREFLIVLGAAGLVVPLFLRLGVSSVLAFLIVGILLGPEVLGRLAGRIPGIDVALINDEGQIAALAEFGIVFLLFLIGLELSPERLLTMRRLVFGMGSLQVVVTTVVIAILARGLGFSLNAALVAGAALSLSSTAIVVQLLSESRRLGTQAGRTSFAVLLFQDLAVIPILLLVSILGRNVEGPVFVGILHALLQAGLAIAAIVIVGRFALRPLLRLVAATQGPDHFLAAVLLIAVGTGIAVTFAGLSMALGAFIAGLMLAETEYRRAIEAIIEPFKGLLLGTFFLLVGLSLRADALLADPLRILTLAVALVALKTTIFYGLARLFRIGGSAAIDAALLLGPCGEFAFVVFSQAGALALLPAAETRDLLTIVTLTMLALPGLAWAGQTLSSLLRAKAMPPSEALAPLPDDKRPRVVIAGFGRVGHLIGSMLDEHKIPYIAVDSDADLVVRERRAGHAVYYGDAANPEFLRRCGLAEAPALAVTMDNPQRVDDVTKTARAMRADLKIIARARDERHAMRLYETGVTEAVPETIESSLQLGEALLVETGVPVGLAIASVHERRDGFRKLLGRPNRRDEIKTLRQRRKATMG